MNALANPLIPPPVKNPPRKNSRQSMVTQDQIPARIGAVSYLNSKPLIEGLGELAPAAQIELDYPSRLADDLASGKLDVALIPSIEYFNQANYEIVSDACVAARGPVLSVKLYTRVPWGEIKTLALDEGSRTSAALSKVMLAERFGVVAKTQPLPMSASTVDSDADAVLLIGDRAMHSPSERFHDFWDLGEEWYHWTGLPFVFAMWVARKGIDLTAVEPALRAARDRGLTQLNEIAQREAAGLGLRVETAWTYLKKNLHFQLGSAERSGLRLFAELASNLELIPDDHNINFRHQRDLATCDQWRTPVSG